jgi:hypothetical protein
MMMMWDVNATWYNVNKYKNSVAINPQAKYTDW